MPEISTYKDSPQKQRVRTECWLPSLQERKQRKAGRLKYLTLPGRNLTELKMLVNEKIIIGMDDLIVCEELTSDYYAICRDLPLLAYTSKAEVPIIARGKIEELLLSGTLDRHLAIDAANFDFVGGAWGNNKTETSKKLDAIRHLMNKQGESATAFTLFVTIATHGGGGVIVDQVLQDYSNDVDEDTWQTISSLPLHGKMLTAFPIILTHYAFENSFDIECTHRYTYIGEGMKTRMLKFAFQIEPMDKEKFRSSRQQQARKERERVNDILQQPTIELYMDVETQTIADRVYNLSEA